MKTCLECTAPNAAEAPTCASCGGASWAEYPAPAREAPSAVEPIVSPLASEPAADPPSPDAPAAPSLADIASIGDGAPSPIDRKPPRRPR